jgi:hypothetical protein
VTETKTKGKFKMTVITGKVYWASVQQPNTTFEPEWGLDLLVDDNNRSQVMADKLTIKNKGDERGDFVHIRQRVARRDGTRNDAPVVLDGQKNPSDSLIGNGSTCNVMYTPFAWDMNGKSGVTPILKKVQIVDLVSYGEDFDVIGGATTPSASSTQMNDEVPF